MDTLTDAEQELRDDVFLLIDRYRRRGLDVDTIGETITDAVEGSWLLSGELRRLDLVRIPRVT